LMSLAMPAYFIKYDFETAEPVRDSSGRCVRCAAGEPGLMVSKIKRDFEFDGYKGNRDLSDKKIVKDVFKKGDRYFNTGDLITTDQDYFLYFTDRIGDTFRWKGENVSTVEVANVVSDLPWIEDANVYGVAIPGQDGRAGMACLVLMKDHRLVEEDMAQLYRHCEDLLPNYARPRFVRVKGEMIITGTYKQRKVEVVKEGFDPAQCGKDPLYYIDFAKKTYIPIDNAVFEKINTGVIRF